MKAEDDTQVTGQKTVASHLTIFKTPSLVPTACLTPPFSSSSSSSLSHTAIHTLVSSTTYKIIMASTLNHLSGFSDLLHLSVEKLQQLDVVLKSILALPIAEDTFAQILDGKPSWQSKPSDEARQRYGEFRKAFSIQALKLNAQVR